MIVLLRLNMTRFQNCDYRQCVMLAINLEDRLQPDTFEHAIHFLIENHIDLSVYVADRSSPFPKQAVTHAVPDLHHRH